MAGYTLTRNHCTARNKRNYVQFQLNLIFQRTFNVLLVKFSFGKLKMVEQHLFRVKSSYEKLKNAKKSTWSNWNLEKVRRIGTPKENAMFRI